MAGRKNSNYSPLLLVLLLKVEYMVSLQPTDARRALPCWDEPLFKATFSVTLISRKGTVNLSNMSARPDVAVADTFTEHLFEGVKDGSWHATSFDTTPPVSIEFNRSPDFLMAE
jgi:aminopeptidase N